MEFIPGTALLQLCSVQFRNATGLHQWSHTTGSKHNMSPLYFLNFFLPFLAVHTNELNRLKQKFAGQQTLKGTFRLFRTIHDFHFQKKFWKEILLKCQKSKLYPEKTQDAEFFPGVRGDLSCRASPARVIFGEKERKTKQTHAKQAGRKSYL